MHTDSEAHGTQSHAARLGFIFMLIFKMAFGVKAWFKCLDQVIAKGEALQRKSGRYHTVRGPLFKTCSSPLALEEICYYLVKV